MASRTRPVLRTSSHTAPVGLALDRKLRNPSAPPPAGCRTRIRSYSLDRSGPLSPASHLWVFSLLQSFALSPLAPDWGQTEILRFQGVSEFTPENVSDGC